MVTMYMAQEACERWTTAWNLAEVIDYDHQHFAGSTDRSRTHHEYQGTRVRPRRTLTCLRQFMGDFASFYLCNDSLLESSCMGGPKEL
jgi:hypothetical protein